MSFSVKRIGCAVAPLLIALGGCAVAVTPLAETEIADGARQNVMRLGAEQEPLKGTVSLYEAMARALKYNLDYRIEMMQSALRRSEVDLATADLIPRVVSKAGYSGRDSYLSVSSLDIPTGLDVEPNTVSQEREFSDGDVTFSWNVLDFALSYVRARQAADRHLIAQEVKRKVIQRILEDTRTAYWRALSADRMSKKLARIEGRVKRALAGSRTVLSVGAQSPLTALTYERELMQIRRTAEQLQHELNLAKSQLALLMNVAPGTEFKVVDDGRSAVPGAIGLSTREMVAEAIFNRPEIREVAYQRRINENEAQAALLELLPGIQQYGTAAFDDNMFLLHGNWLSWGAAAAGNLIKLAQLPARSAVIDATDVMLDQRSLATTMVVMTQVYVSRTRYVRFKAELDTARQYVDVQSKLVEQLSAEAVSGSIGEQTLIREEMNLLVGEVERDIAAANVESATANLLVSMGLDLQAGDVDLRLGVRPLADHIRITWADRVALSDRGKYLLEVERAREEERRRKEEEERRIKAEAQRIADEARRIKENEVRLAQEAARLAREEAERARQEQVRLAKEEARKLKEDAERAKAAAEAARVEAARIAAEEARVAKLEAERARKDALQEKNEQLRRAKDEARQMKAEALRAKEEALRLRQAEEIEARRQAKAAADEARVAKAESERERHEAQKAQAAEQRRAQQERLDAKKEAARIRQSEILELKAEARRAKEEVRRTRRWKGTAKDAAPAQASEPRWVWPWELEASKGKIKVNGRESQMRGRPSKGVTKPAGPADRS